MTVSRARAWEYAEKILDVPRHHVPVTLKHGKSGVVLLHNGRVLTRCYNSLVGKWGAKFMAEALGVPLPDRGNKVQIKVSTGVLFRAMSISSLNLRDSSAPQILERLLEEAYYQRGPSNTAAR